MVSSDKPTACAVQPDIVAPSDAPTQSLPKRNRYELSSNLKGVRKRYTDGNSEDPLGIINHLKRQQEINLYQEMNM